MCTHSIRYEAHPAPLSRAAAPDGAIQKTQYGHVIVVDRISYRYTRTCVPKVLFLRRAQQGLQRSSSAIDAPIGRLPLRLFIFSFPFLFPMLPSRFKKCARGFPASKVLQDPRGINFRNVRPRVSRPLADPTRPVFPFVFRPTYFITAA